jgi:peptidoglycan/LPS O-acetylase OafA/YrhL
LSSSSVRIARGGALDALRFFAAAFIVVFHVGDDAPVPLRQVHDIFNRGYLASDFFLILSGFVLACIYGGQVLERRLSPVQFFARRVARNYPAHLITLAGLVLMVLAAQASGHPVSHPERFPWSALPIHLLMLHGWGLAPDTWNVPTWTISALFLCYAAFPWLWPALQRLGGVRACILAALAVLLGSDLAARLLTGQQAFDLPFQWGLLRAAPLFLVGLCLARLLQVATLEGRGANLAVAGAAALVGNIVFPGPDLLSIIAVCAVIVGCGAMGGQVKIPGAEWGAKISFSLFFTHTLSDALYNDALRSVLLRFGDGPAWRWTIWGGELAFALALAIAFHHFVDAPIQRWVRNRLFRGSPARRPALAPSV